MTFQLDINEFSSDWLTNNLHILHVSMFWVPLKSMWRRVSHLVTPCLERMYGRHTDMFTCKYIFYIKCDVEPEWKKIVCNFFKSWIILSTAYLILFCCLTIICKMISCMELLIIYQSLFSCRNSHLFVYITMVERATLLPRSLNLFVC